MLRESRGRAAWVVPLLLCAAILLVAGLAFNLAYLDTGGEHLPATPGTTSPNPGPTGIVDPQITAALAVSVFVGFMVVTVLFARRRNRVPVKRVLRPTTWADVAALLITFTVFGLILVLWPKIVAAVSPAAATGGANSNATANATAVPTVAGIPLGVFLAAATFVAILLLALFFRVGSSLARRPPPSLPRAPRHAAAELVQTAIDELQLGADVRTAILACYARFCALLGAKGIASQDALTARELEDLAVGRLSVSQDSAEALTSLFEEARYSEHILGDADRDRAVRSLERIRADLEA